MVKEIEFISDLGRVLLHQHHLDSFDALWQFEQGNWFEAPNHRRGGWSGVSKTKLTMPDGSLVSLFIKRQENHVYQSWQHFFRPMATFEREYRNILAFQEHAIPTLDLMYFGQRSVNGKLRAILITRELSGYQSLDVLMASKALSRPTKGKLFACVAEAMRAMHAQHFQHNCLYPKHIFISEQAMGGFDVRFIDLEKAKRWPFKGNVALRDLGTLHRHSEHLSMTDRLRFFLAYRQEKRLNHQSKKMLVALSKKKTCLHIDLILNDIEDLAPQLQDAA